MKAWALVVLFFGAGCVSIPHCDPAQGELAYKECSARRELEMAERQRRANVFRSMQQPQPQQVNCRSNTYGGTTYTNCQ